MNALKRKRLAGYAAVYGLVGVGVLASTWALLIISRSIPIGGFVVVVLFAAAEELVRGAATQVALKRLRLGLWVCAFHVGLAFGILEISNALFPDRYASQEAREAPFLLLAIFEFLFGFLLHASLTAIMYLTINRVGLVVAILVMTALHSTVNALLLG